MIAAVCPWHEHHAPVARSLERRFAREQRLAIAGHALLEGYAVLTRMPHPHRLSGEDAWHLLQHNFAEHATVLGCDGGSYVSLIGELAGAGTTGGRSYDKLIAKALAPAGGLELLTLNPRHFNPPPRGMVVVDPRTDP